MRNIASQNAKVSEEALICVLDICRAAFRVQPEENVEHGVQMFANDIAHELKVRYSWTCGSGLTEGTHLARSGQLEWDEAVLGVARGDRRCNHRRYSHHALPLRS